MTLSIGPLRPDETPAFCALFQRVFAVSLKPETRHWKYQQGPRLGSVSLMARDTRGNLRGHVGALVFPGVCAGRMLPMAQVCDVMVDPDARGGVDHGGVYGRLMAELQRELAQAYPGAFAYGFAGIRPYKLGARMGLYRAVQPCRMGVVQFRHATGTGGGARPASRWPWAWTARHVPWHHPALGRLWERLGTSSQGPRVQRTPAYLQWRYAGHPQHRYQAWLLCRWGRAQGWVATRWMPDGSLCVVDSLLPAGATVRHAAEVLAPAVGALLSSPDPSSALAAAPHLPSGVPSIASWDIATEASALLEPIMGCEVRVDRWHSDQFKAHFHPGDTDVF
jgi:hypothetical protein